MNPFISICVPDLHNAAPIRITRDEGGACVGVEGSFIHSTPSSFAAEMLLVHYGEEIISAICYISCDCHMTSFTIGWSIEKVRT